MASPSGTDDRDPAPREVIATVEGTATISPGVQVVAPVAVHPDAVRLRFSAYSIIRAVLVVVVSIGVLMLVRAAATPLWWLAIATAVAGFFQPAALLLRRSMPGWLAILVVVLAVFAVVGLVGYRGYSEVSTQFTTLRNNAVQAAKDISESKQFGQVASEFGLVEKVERFFEAAPFQLSGADNAVDAAQSAASSGGALFAIAMLSLLMLVFGRRLVLSAVVQIEDPDVEARVRTLLLTSYTMSSKYVWLMAARSVAIGLIAGVGSALVGFDAPTAIGVWFAVLSLLPALGIVIAAVPLVALESISSVSIAVALFIIAIGLQLADVLLVQTRIEARSVRVGPALTTIAVLVGMQLYGLGGALVMLALVVFSVSVVHTVTRGADDVFTALRALFSHDAVVRVEPDAAVAASAAD